MKKLLLLLALTLLAAGLAGCGNSSGNVAVPEKPVLYLYPEEETEVLPLPANHDPAEKAMIFAIRRQGRQLLVANDSGWPADEVFDALRDWRFDAVIADCTGGTFTNGVNHMGGMVTVELRDRLKEQGSLAPECRFIANHFSHNGNCTYEEIVNFFTPHGIETAYDGFRFTL